MLQFYLKKNLGYIPQLEYCIQFFVTMLLEEYDSIGVGAEEFTRMLPGMMQFSYEERMDRLGPSP